MLNPVNQKELKVHMCRDEFKDIITSTLKYIASAPLIERKMNERMRG